MLPLPKSKLLTKIQQNCEKRGDHEVAGAKSVPGIRNCLKKLEDRRGPPHK